MTSSKSIFQITLLILAISFFTSCKDDAELPELTTQEVADILEPAIQKSAAGLPQYIETLIENVEEIAVDVVCDSVYVKLISFNNPGQVVQSDFTSDWTFNLACNNLNIPQTALFSSAALTTYNTPRISADDEAAFSGDLAGIAPSSDIYELNCNYIRIGTQSFKGADPKDVNSSLVMNVMDIEIEKTTNIIQTGAGDFSLIGDIDGTSFSKVGDILFNGDGTATLTINDEMFEIDLD